MTEVRTPYRPPELVNASAVENAFAPISERNTLAQAQQALDSLFNRPVSLADAEVSMPGRYTSIEGIHPAPAPVELPHQYYESPVALGPAHPSKAMGGAIFDQSIGTWRPRTGLDVATTTTGLPPGMEGDFVRTAEQRGQIAAELEARQQKESFAALSGSEQLSVKVYDLVRAAERVPQNIRKVVTTVWEQANGLIPRINTKFNVALSAAASMAALSACGGALPKSPEPTPTPRIVQTVDVVKPTATATTPFETPTPPAVTKEQLANVLIQQDTYTADVVESWKGDMTPTQLLARKVLKGELGPEDDAAEVRSMSYSMKNAGGFSFDIAASASDQSKMRIGFVSPDGSLQMRDVRAVQEQNGAVSLLMTQEGKILVIARRSLDGTAFVINPADASGVIKKIGDNSPDLSLGKDIIVIPPSPTPGPKQPNLDLLAYLFPPQTVKAESQPTPGQTAGNVFSDTVEARASATPFTPTATVTAPITGSETLTRTELAPTILTEIQRSEGVSDTTYRLNTKESGGVRQISIANITFADGKTARPDFTPKALKGLSDMTLSALVINQSLSTTGNLPDSEDMPRLLEELKKDIAAGKAVDLNMVRVEPGTFVLKPYPTKLQPKDGGINIEIVDADGAKLPQDCDRITLGTNTDGTAMHTVVCATGNTVYLGIDSSNVRPSYNANAGSPTSVTTPWTRGLGQAQMGLAMIGRVTEKRLGKGRSDGGSLYGTGGANPVDAGSDWAAFLRGATPTEPISRLMPNFQTFANIVDGKQDINAKFNIR